MKITIFGAGAIGCHLAANLAKTDCDVSVVARGNHLKAIQHNGLVLRSNGVETRHRLRATDDPAELGPQDYVIITLKAHQAPGAAEAMRSLLGPETAVVTAMNGVPWWYFHRAGRDLPEQPVDAVDPGAVQWRQIGPERAIGCVVWVAATVPEPGVCAHGGGKGYLLGEPDGTSSSRITALSQYLEAAGLDAPLRGDIRKAIWSKLVGNMCFNPVSVLTQATVGQMATDPAVREVLSAIMTEGVSVARALGVELDLDVEKRITNGARVGGHKTSMLQDLERGRELELAALVEAPAQLARLAGVPTPQLDSVLAMARLRQAASQMS